MSSKIRSSVVISHKRIMSVEGTKQFLSSLHLIGGAETFAMDALIRISVTVLE